MKKIMTRKIMSCNKVYTICYNALDVFNSKKEAKEFYSSCYYMSEGAEHERYASILVNLNFSNIGKDNSSTYCSKINIKNFTGDDDFIKITLNNKLSIEDTIKYYEETIEPILEVSNEYEINFNNKIPFEDFGADSENYNMHSFSNYYKDILKKYDIKVDNIYTKEKSDGKYELIINDKIIDIKAWDNLNSVIDNMDTFLDSYKGEQLEI